MGGWGGGVVGVLTGFFNWVSRPLAAIVVCCAPWPATQRRRLRAVDARGTSHRVTEFFLPSFFCVLRARVRVIGDQCVGLCTLPSFFFPHPARVGVVALTVGVGWRVSKEEFFSKKNLLSQAGKPKETE